jgi:8-oxo-dGTP diphosphatase
MEKIIQAVAGVIIKDDKVLLTSRPSGKIYANYWEFPGGKLEPKENAVLALVRELKEEINLEVKCEDCQLFATIEHLYEHGMIQLNVVKVKEWSGYLQPLEGQNIYWQDLHKECQLHPCLPTTDKILTLIKQQ